ncbi:hypothetical protein PGT21_011808 [Puccinia graminis f. sp. tritici]|uniref:Uncharacterized protein n=2 Tax=Puccinia graminis f. sp. tritici TaxID=56615 RepID=E3K2U4_PUCGT|nr:uncharacterized protein PGTG_04619 [Puccinia graminis f. sp. tritici CRL 75-36-700-3]EFP78663.2 hypothetical protein PGTG_04619 [Puccinia graminis f. sp. tritici CRL 75-36-700-3]KAA1110137.1 hypothetical protein PGT21_011808 [Puccinia graminis f. sp. tritici]
MTTTPPPSAPDNRSAGFAYPAQQAPALEGNPTVFTQFSPSGKQRRPSVIVHKIQPRQVSNPKCMQSDLAQMRAAFAKNAQVAPVNQEAGNSVNQSAMQKTRGPFAQVDQTASPAINVAGWVPRIPSEASEAGSNDEEDATGRPSGPQLSSKLVSQIEKIPAELSFLLEPNNDLQKRSCTKELILKGIRHFIPSYKPPVKQPKKGLLVRAFQLQILPLIAPYVQWKMEQFEQAAADESVEMQEDPAPVDLSGINPNNPSITTDIILTIIAERRPSTKLPETMSKSAAINFFHQYISPRPPHGYPQAFTTWPTTVPMPYHRFLTRDELRYIIQCYVGILFIPCAIGKVHLLAIYEQFVLDEISEENIYEGIHYFVRQDPNPPQQ